MADKINIVIADDHPLFRAGVRQALAKEDRIVVVDEADDGEQALKKITERKPDVAVLDINMPRLSGLDVARRADATGLETKIILLTMIEDRKIFLEAMDLGVMGYVLKDSAVSEIARAILSVSEDKHFISPTLSGSLLRRKSQAQTSSHPSLSDLTPTEHRILKLIGELKSNQEIADELFISKRTVENHRVNMAKKLSLSGTNSLLKFALEHRQEP